MTKKTLEKEIKHIKGELADKGLPADVRKTLEKALAKAEAMLEKEEYDQPFSGSKRPSKIKDKAHDDVTSSLDDCEEILAKYRKRREKEEHRTAKRERAGKPAELTIPETVKKAAGAVKTKVEKKKESGKKVTVPEVDASRTQIVDMVKKLLEALPTEKERHSFVSGLIAELRDLDVEKAEKGTRTKGEPMKGQQMRIFHYKTEYFDISPEAREYFKRILENEPAAEKHKHVIMAMARDVDDLLGHLKASVYADKLGKQDFMYAVGKLMRAMYWSHGVVEAVDGPNADPGHRYPSFLAHDMYLIANHTEKSDERFKLPAGAKKEDGGVIEEEEIVVVEEVPKKEKGGKVKFKDKVKAIEKNLEGKSVKPPYRGKYGKTYTKKTATAAAENIAGAMERNKKKGRKGTKKKLLGGFTIYTPDSMALIGDRNNLDIHNVGGGGGI